ncbi:Ig-like domain-containing protein [Endozoicomonas sp. NE40]|uniref:Lipoprotein NlpE involved in copper resistance n=1 Tax=Endozoicomonas lisbonensis TaxID=3120522 RepID=A0ABV2SPF3_9GAMM
MAPVYNPQNAPVFFVGVKGDVTIKDQAGNDIKLKKGDKIPADARIIVGDGGQIVFKQANKTLKYESQGEASLSNALTESSDATLDPGIKNLVEAAEQITTTPDSSSEATPAQQPLAKPVARSDASMPSPTSAKQGISEPPEIVHADRGENPQPDATEIVTKMAEEVATRSDAIRASTTETEDLLPSAGETVAFEHSHEPVAPDETPLPPAAPDITSFAPNTGSGDDNITLEKELTISGSAPAGTHVILLCDGAVIKEGIQVSSQGQWSTRWNTGKDGSFTLTATASSGSGTSAPSSAFTVEVDSRAPALEFDNPASDDNYNFVTYNKAAVITGTATPGLTFTLTQGDNHWEVTADDKGTWSQAVANLNDGLTEFSASSVSVAGVEVHKTAKLLVQSTPYDFKIQPDTGISDSDTITSSEDLLLTVKSQPDATVVLTILGIDVKSTVNKDGLAEFPITLAGDNAYTCQLKTIYTNNEGESDTVEETITLDTTPAIISLDPPSKHL